MRELGVFLIILFVLFVIVTAPHLVTDFWPWLQQLIQRVWTAVQGDPVLMS